MHKISCYLFVSLLDQYPNGFKILDNHKTKLWKLSSIAEEMAKISPSLSFHPEITYFIFKLWSAGQVDDYCSVLYLDKSKFSLHLGDKASTYSYWIVYISMSFIGDSYVRNLVHEMVITLISIYTKEFVCTVNNQNIHWDGYTAQ